MPGSFQSIYRIAPDSPTTLVSFLVSLLCLYGYPSPFSMSALQACFILSFSALILTSSLPYHFKSGLLRFHNDLMPATMETAPCLDSPTTLGLNPSPALITVSIITLMNSYQDQLPERGTQQHSYLSYSACPEGLGSF